MRKIFFLLSALLLSGCHGLEEGHGIDRILSGGKTGDPIDYSNSAVVPVYCCPPKDSETAALCAEIKKVGGVALINRVRYLSVCLPEPS